jgi:protein-tyrosine-phosphatase
MTAPASTTRVLFICHANLVRSPLAEGIFRHLVAQRGLGDRFAIDSAGIAAHEGMAPDPGSIAVAAQHGIKLGGRARQMTRLDLYDHDHVLVADRHVAAQIRRLIGGSVFGRSPAAPRACACSRPSPTPAPRTTTSTSPTRCAAAPRVI